MLVVDSIKRAKGKFQRYCHCTSTLKAPNDRQELEALCWTLHFPITYLQRHKNDKLHLDLTFSKRRQVVQAGARRVSNRDYVRIVTGTFQPDEEVPNVD